MRMVPDKAEGKERRQFIRIKKNYIIRFCAKSNPALKFEVSQVENVSKGGLCFTSTIKFNEGDDLAIELRTPYVTDIIYLEGNILHIQETIKGLLYSNRLKFHDISPEAAIVLEKIEKYNLHKADHQ
jgi:hypothetical protein